MSNHEELKSNSNKISENFHIKELIELAIRQRKLIHPLDGFDDWFETMNKLTEASWNFILSPIKVVPFGSDMVEIFPKSDIVVSRNMENGKKSYTLFIPAKIWSKLGGIEFEIKYNQYIDKQVLDRTSPSLLKLARSKS